MDRPSGAVHRDVRPGHGMAPGATEWRAHSRTSGARLGRNKSTGLRAFAGCAAVADHTVVRPILEPAPGVDPGDVCAGRPGARRAEPNTHRARAGLPLEDSVGDRPTAD